MIQLSLHIVSLNLSEMQFQEPFEIFLHIP